MELELFFKYLFIIYLAALGLSSGPWHVRF